MVAVGAFAERRRACSARRACRFAACGFGKRAGPCVSRCTACGFGTNTRSVGCGAASGRARFDPLRGATARTLCASPGPMGRGPGPVVESFAGVDARRCLGRRAGAKSRMLRGRAVVGEHQHASRRLAACAASSAAGGQDGRNPDLRDAIDGGIGRPAGLACRAAIEGRDDGAWSTGRHGVQASRPADGATCRAVGHGPDAEHPAPMARLVRLERSGCVLVCSVSIHPVAWPHHPGAAGSALAGDDAARHCCPRFES